MLKQWIVFSGSVFRTLWLATQSVNILHYSLIHLQFLRARDAKTHISCEQNASQVCCRNKQRNFTNNRPAVPEIHEADDEVWFGSFNR